MLRKIQVILISALLFTACTTINPLTKTSVDAHTAFINENYAEALRLYEQMIQQQSTPPTIIPDTVHRNAGIAAFNLGQKEKSLNYLNLIRSTAAANAQTHYILAVTNREINNLSREITALESLVENHPDASYTTLMRPRLFETYVESKNYNKALEIWPSIEVEARQNESLLNEYFTTLEATEKNEELMAVSNELLALNPDNTDALFFLGKHFFWKAENRYQSEMEAYEKNRTNRQYAQLLRAFEVLNADFRKSLDHFLKLYKTDPQPRYARFIGNIYLRFEDKGKAEFYHKKADQ